MCGFGVVDEQGGEVAVCGEGVEGVLGDAFADLLPWCGGVVGVVDVDLAEHAVDDGGDQCRPVWEVPVERGGAGVKVGGEGLQGHGLGPVGVDDLECAIEDEIPVEGSAAARDADRRRGGAHGRRLGCHGAQYC